MYMERKWYISAKASPHAGLAVDAQIIQFIESLDRFINSIKAI
jgi:hypothetical protein